jgi:hypothetical protein
MRAGAQDSLDSRNPPCAMAAAQCDNVKYFTHGFRHSRYGDEATEVGNLVAELGQRA